MEFQASNKATQLDLVSRFNRVKEFDTRVSEYCLNNLVSTCNKSQQSNLDLDICSKWSMSDKFRWGNQDD